MLLALKRALPTRKLCRSSPWSLARLPWVQEAAGSSPAVPTVIAWVLWQPPKPRCQPGSVVLAA